MKKLNGIAASAGIVVAKVFKYIEPKINITNKKGDPQKEIAKFEKAVKATLKQLEQVKNLASKNLSDEEIKIFDAHMQVASDPAMHEEILAKINEEKINAPFAIDFITKKYYDTFSNMDDEYMRERAADIKDVAKRIINNVLGIKQTGLNEINSEVIIVAHDLTPSDTAQLNKKYVKGFVTNIGGRTSHSAIMARSLEVPAILGLKNITKFVENDDMVAIDGNTGEIIINPNKDEIKKIKNKILDFKKQLAENLKYKGKKTLTKDNHQVELAANIGSPNDLDGVIENDAEAVGLFRSEFLYMDNHDWPTEEEQFQAYKKVVSRMKNKRVIVRTLDIGGDKKLSYFNFPVELNPFLGYRAIRFSLDKQDIFKTQLRALIRASEFGNLSIMFPMIATIDEIKRAKNIFNKIYQEIKNKNKKIANKIPIGIMVEIPAVAIHAKNFAKHVDFFSIGTNDLMQYTMAADRMSEKVSYLYQPLNPSILNLIKLTIDGAHSQNKWVGMCGEMAGDTNVVPILIGLGLDEFSMSALSVLNVRRQISKLDLQEMQKLAKNALEQDTQEDVQKIINKFITKK